MSIFEAPRPFLNTKIWDNTEHVKPEVHKYLFELLNQIFPMDKLYHAVMLGSNTTYQYSDTSDIDINIGAIPGESYEYWHTVFKKFNHKNNLLPGTEHPINFFFQEYTAHKGDWTISLGAYDLIKNEWIKHPMPFEQIGDPNVRYAEQIAYVKLMLTMVGSEIKNIEIALQSGDRSKALNIIKYLQKYFKQLEENRHLAYTYGIGTPSIQEGNLIYKLIEHGPYGKFFKDLLGAE